MSNTGPLRIRAFALALAATSLFSGCASFRYNSPDSPSDERNIRMGVVILAPVENATDDENAGRALTELLGTALFERRVAVYQTEAIRTKVATPKAAGADGIYADVIKETGATHIIFATVHEYRYKTDLDGDPAVAVTVRVVDAQTGITVWQGSSGNVGYVFASLSSSAQYAVRRLVSRIPIIDRLPLPEKPPEGPVIPAAAK